MKVKVPLVLYREGKRQVIGQAEIESDGTMTCEITAPKIIEALGMAFFKYPGELSIAAPKDDPWPMQI